MEDNTFHLFTFDIGSSVCKQLTFGRRSDHSPCWLPNGRIVFMSERRNTTARCAGSRHQPTSALYSIQADGTDLIRLSWHDTEEWDPSITNEGMIVYTRWDYLDRDFHIAHHMWLCYPDGRDPRAPHGNYPLPHSTLEADYWEDGRAWRPWGEYNIRAIPNSTQYIAIAGGHHNTGMYGAPIILDVGVADDNRTSQVKRITPGRRWINEACPPNFKGGKTVLPSKNSNEMCEQDAHYGYPRPLSEDFYLVTEGSGDYRRIFLLDRFGNREVIYSGFAIPQVSGLRMVSPMPFRPRTKPPVLPTAGCHEDKWKVPEVPAQPLALQHPPSKITPEVGGVEPVNFHRLVRPVFEAKCKSCHEAQKQPPDFSYDSLEPYATNCKQLEKISS